MSIKYIILTTLLFTITNVVIWYQLNSQLVWDWAKGTKSMLFMSLMGIPISILFWYYSLDCCSAIFVYCRKSCYIEAIKR